MATCNDNCGKVSVKIAGFTGCLDAPGLLSAIDSASIFGAANPAGSIAYLGAKCVKIACPPVLVLDDNMASLAIFLDSQNTVTDKLDCSSATASIDTTRTRAGIAKMISCCTTDCCTQC
jgi:hypothetical protein